METNAPYTPATIYSATAHLTLFQSEALSLLALLFITVGFLLIEGSLYNRFFAALERRRSRSSSASPSHTPVLKS